MINIMSLLSMIILFMILVPTHQRKYLCNPTSECGCSTKPANVARIVNGEDASIGSWAWAVSISLDYNRLYCGGSILSSSWIITAAHCVEGLSASSMIVYAGSNIHLSGSQNKTVSEVIMHPDYDSTKMVSDIALLRLSSPLNMTDPAVSPICLASNNSQTSTADEWPVPNTPVTAVGWGRRAEHGNRSINLQQVTLKTIDYQSRLCTLLTDSESQLCAGVQNSDKDTCFGDSGGPLMMFTENKQWLLVGLTSFGRGCAQKEYAGIYTRVAAFEHWIAFHTKGAYSKAKDLLDTTTIPSAIKSYANDIFSKNYFNFLNSLLLFYFEAIYRMVL